MNKTLLLPNGWRKVLLSEFMEFKNGVNAGKEAYGKGTKFVNIMDIFKKPFLTEKDVAGLVLINDKQKQEYSVKYGDILFNRTSEIPNEIAFSSVYIGGENITFGGFVIRGRQIKNYLTPEYAGYCFKSEYIRKEMIERSQGVVRSNIGQKDLNKIFILIPPHDEQKQIALTLLNFDTLINKTKELIIIKKKQLEWLKCKLIIKAKSHRIPINSFIKEISKRNVNNKITRVFSVTNHSGFVLSETQFERRVASLNLANYKIVRKGEFAYNPSRINVGSIARLDNFEEGVLSPMYMVFKLDEAIINSDYFLYWLNSSEIRQRIKKSAQGSVRETVSLSDLGAIQIVLPSLEQQKVIANTLNTARNEITVLSQLLQRYSQQKNCLMQKLLTGEWHIKNRKVG